VKKLLISFFLFLCFSAFLNFSGAITQIEDGDYYYKSLSVIPYVEPFDYKVRNAHFTWDYYTNGEIPSFAPGFAYFLQYGISPYQYYQADFLNEFVNYTQDIVVYGDSALRCSKKTTAGTFYVALREQTAYRIATGSVEVLWQQDYQNTSENAHFSSPSTSDNVFSFWLSNITNVGAAENLGLCYIMCNKYAASTYVIGLTAWLDGSGGGHTNSSSIIISDSFTEFFPLLFHLKVDFHSGWNKIKYSLTVYANNSKTYTTLSTFVLGNFMLQQRMGNILSIGCNIGWQDGDYGNINILAVDVSCEPLYFENRLFSSTTVETTGYVCHFRDMYFLIPQEPHYSYDIINVTLIFHFNEMLVRLTSLILTDNYTWFAFNIRNNQRYVIPTRFYEWNRSVIDFSLLLNGYINSLRVDLTLIAFYLVVPVLNPSLTEMFGIFANLFPVLLILFLPSLAVYSVLKRNGFLIMFNFMTLLVTILGLINFGFGIVLLFISFILSYKFIRRGEEG
jgi:hypothetical protein